MARLKELAVGRGGDTFLFDPDQIEEIQGYNCRDMQSPETQAYIRSMADAIKASGTSAFPPITIRQEAGKIYVVAGHCRRRAHSIAKAEGAPIKGILAMANTQNEEERTLDLLASNNGLPLTPLEKANAVKRLLSFSWSPAEIAKKLGWSQTTIGNLITLIEAPREVREMVAAGEISASMAVAEIRKDKESAASSLAGAVEKAKGVGRSRATAKDVREKKTELSFDAGVVWACARMVDMYDQPSMAQDILKESAVDVRKAIEYDVAFLRKKNPDLPKGIK